MAIAAVASVTELALSRTLDLHLLLRDAHFGPLILPVVAGSALSVDSSL